MTAKLWFRTDGDVIRCIGDFATEDGSTHGHWYPEVRPGEDIFGISYDDLGRVLIKSGRWEGPLRGQSGQHLLILSFSAFDPNRTLAGSKSRSAAVSRDVEVCYTFGWKRGRTGSETARVHHAGRRRGGMAARGASAAV
jgi:hypothetical protein